MVFATKFGFNELVVGPVDGRFTLAKIREMIFVANAFTLKVYGGHDAFASRWSWPIGRKCGMERDAYNVVEYGNREDILFPVNATECREESRHRWPIKLGDRRWPDSSNIQYRFQRVEWLLAAEVMSTFTSIYRK